MIVKYGREFLPINGREWGPLEIEYAAFRDGYTVESGGKGKHVHFLNLVRETWPDTVIHEWYEEAAFEICNNPVYGATGGASSSKSDILAKWALVNWFADPVNTLVIVVSTSAVDAKQRIWGGVVAGYRSARAAKKSVGKLIESTSIIKLSEGTDGIAASDNSSIILIPAGDEYREDSLKRLQGKHQRNVRLVIDELQDCSPLIVESAIWNMNTAEDFHVSAACNANSRFGPDGIYFQPIDGWTQVNRTTHRWKIRVGGKEGVALHFNPTDPNSPNMKRYVQGLPQLPFLRRAEDCLTAKTHLGENNPTYMRQFVGFWPDSESETNYLITEQEITTHQATESIYWQSSPTDFAGMDPSYSQGGDRFVLYHLQYGLSTHGIWTIFFKEAITVKVAPQPGETKDFAAVRQCKALAAERNISPRNIGTDASAATSFTSILHREWSPEILPVSFGGAPTDLPVSFYDKRLASDIYCDRSTELLGVLHEFVIQGQIRGMSPQHVKEAISRQYKQVGAKIRLESKVEMKKRLGYSPDVLDAGNIGVATIRERLKVQAGNSTATASTHSADWRKLARKCDVVSRGSQQKRNALPW